MRRKKTQMLDEVLMQLMRQEGLETPLNEYRLVNEAWPEVVGRAVLRYTGDMQIRNQTLFIKITSPALKQNLSMMRTQLVLKLNEYVGAQVIANIVFQ